MASYSCSKAAVIGLVKSVGKEYAETGITVNGLAPAVVRTAMVDGLSPDVVKYMTDKIPMKRSNCYNNNNYLLSLWEKYALLVMSTTQVFCYPAIRSSTFHLFGGLETQN